MIIDLSTYVDADSGKLLHNKTPMPQFVTRGFIQTLKQTTSSSQRNRPPRGAASLP
jgi:hypothetical protein